MKRITKALLLCTLLAVMTLVSFAVPAAFVDIQTVEGSSYEVNEEAKAQLSAGLGTELYPYEISDYTQFNEYAQLINSKNSTYVDAYYALTNNIDFAGNDIVPMGVEASPFKGHLDGRGYKMMNVPVADTKFSGIVGYMSAGSVKNLAVSYVKSTGLRKELATSGMIFGGIVSCTVPEKGKSILVTGCLTDGYFMYKTNGCVYFGGIVGKAKSENGGVTVSNCVTDFEFNIKSTDISYVAGIAGYSFSGSSQYVSLKNCVAYGNINLVVTNGVGANAGGLVAYIDADGSGWSGWAEDTASLMADVNNLENCFACGDVYASSYYSNKYKEVHIGGLIGKLSNEENLRFSNCYRSASASISGEGTVVSCTSGTAIQKTEFESENFFDTKLKLDLANVFYFSGTDDKVQLRTTARSGGGADTSNILDLRLDSKSGIRFTAQIDIYKRGYVAEYGFIIAIKSDLGEDELTFDCGKKYASAAAYNTDDGTDVIFKNDEAADKITFKGVLINVPKSHYSTVVVTRPYVRYVTEGETVYLYGAPIEASINEVADLIAASEAYDTLTEDQKDKLATMVTGA